MYTEIRTFEDACDKLNIQPVLPDVSMLRLENQKAVIANYKLDIIQEAINEGWKADWGNMNQYKYYPWFKKSLSGSGFLCNDFICDLTHSSVKSQRVYKSGAIAMYVGNQFLDLYKDSIWIE